jgi:hypothetical protein
MAMKETEELLKGLFDILKVSAELLKDGAQVSDLVAGYQKLEGDPVKAAELKAALDNVSAVPGEVGGMKWTDGADLIVFVVKELPELLAAFK